MSTETTKPLSKSHTIAYLADHPEFVETVGFWAWREWDAANGWTRQQCVDFLRNEACNKDRMDITLIALNNAGECIGCIQLMRDDNLENFQHLTPWIGLFYIEPAYRNGRVARDLWNRIVEICSNKGIEDSYAHTAVLQRFLRRRNAAQIGHGFYSGKAVDVFHIKVKDARL